jgi:hypothetical protein
MPYLKCGRCGLTTFSAAYWSNVDYCAGCGERFPRSLREAATSVRHRRAAKDPGGDRPSGEEHGRAGVGDG